MRRLEIQYINPASLGAFSSMKIKPPTFDGSTSWTVYIRQFEAAANINGWNDQEKATALIVALRGPALDLLQSIPSIYQQDYQHLSQTLELRFGDHYRQEVFRTQVKSRIQKPGESLQEFESEVKRLVSLAFPAAGKDIQGWMAVSTFIDGLRDSKIQENLRMSKFRKSSEALVRALELEAIFGASTPRIRAVSIQDPKDEQTSKEDGSFKNLMSKFTEKMKKQVLEIRQMENESKQTPTPRNRVKCYRCQKLGHMQWDCRLRMSSPSRDRSQSFWKSRDASPKHRPGNPHEKNTSPVLRRTGLIVDDKWTTKQMREDQETDHDIGQILHLKENDECRPEWREVSNKSLIYKAVWAQWNSLAVENGLLQRVWESADGRSTKSQLVIPKDRVEDVLKKIHDGTSGVHFGVNKTLDKIRKRFYWVFTMKTLKAGAENATPVLPVKALN